MIGIFIALVSAVVFYLIKAKLIEQSKRNKLWTAVSIATVFGIFFLCRVFFYEEKLSWVVTAIFWAICMMLIFFKSISLSRKE